MYTAYEAIVGALAGSVEAHKLTVCSPKSLYCSSHESEDPERRIIKHTIGTPIPIHFLGSIRQTFYRNSDLLVYSAACGEGLFSFLYFNILTYIDGFVATVCTGHDSEVLGGS